MSIACVSFLEKLFFPYRKRDKIVLLLWKVGVIMSDHIGARIRNLREKKGWSQRELARRVNLNASVMNRIELGTRPVADHELVRFADVFEISSDYLLGRTTDVHSKIKEDPYLYLPENVNHFLKEYEQLNEEDQKQIARMVRALLKLAEDEQKKRLSQKQV
jgi:transcriptional regulator with XRE-family HTH domain